MGWTRPLIGIQENQEYSLQGTSMYAYFIEIGVVGTLYVCTQHAIHVETRITMNKDDSRY